MTREELMKSRLTVVGEKQGMIDNTDGSASIEYISGFVDGWKEADNNIDMTISNKKLNDVCRWLTDVRNIATRLTSGNVAHDGALIRCQVDSFLCTVARDWIDDDWHNYTKGDLSTAPKTEDDVLVQFENGGYDTAKWVEKRKMLWCNHVFPSPNIKIKAWKYITPL